MQTKTRILSPGTQDGARVFFKVELKNGNASFTGVIGPTSKGYAQSCGQIVGAKVDKLEWTPQQLADFYTLWHRWHLNDMRAGCRHQRESWDARKTVTLQHWGWSPRFRQWRSSAKAGTMAADQYALFGNISARVMALTIGLNCPKWESPEAKALLAEDWIVPGKTETKAAGWVDYREHPDGLLGRPCESCNYQYGSQWLKEELPHTFWEKILAFPESAYNPAWI